MAVEVINQSPVRGVMFRTIQERPTGGDRQEDSYAAVRYAKGDLREVYFYPTQLKGHIERKYRLCCEK